MKFKNYGLWVALGSLLVMFLNDVFHVAPVVTQPYVNTVLTILVAAGIVSNPEKGKGFKDNV
jgi:uncharacterized membrane protein